MAVAQVNNIRIVPGTDFQAFFNVFGPDNSLTSIVGSAVTTAQISKWPHSNNIFNFSTILSDQTGELVLILPKEVTSQLELGRNYYFVDLIKNDITFRVIEGTIIVQK